MSISSLLNRWKTDATINENITAWQVIPAREPRFVPFPSTLHPALVKMLEKQSIKSLYTHQATTWSLARDGHNCVIVTGTASGKTLAYNLPVIDHLMHNPQARAMYLFPTKALAQDQLENLGNLFASGNEITLNENKSRMDVNKNLFGLKFAVYDGDTPTTARPIIRSNANIIISNPDMLHTGILPHHTIWVNFFKNLKFIVLDEIHVYRGVFGSHIANLMRRLKRITKFYGATVQFIMTSATIGNPLEHAQNLIEEPVFVVDEDGSGRGARHFLIYNPPVVDRRFGLRRSALQESARFGEELINYNLQTIIFSRTRRSVEIILTYLRDKLPQKSSISQSRPKIELANVNEIVRGYRGGYLPGQRREIERTLRQGKVKAVIATNALELGIDIGSIECSIMVGYPGTISSTWQQAGRAGRGEKTSLAVLIATSDPLDQFLAHHPYYFFEKTPENALINPNNLLILLDHLRCTAFELPLCEMDKFGNVSDTELAEFLDLLCISGVLHKSGDKYFWMSEHYPAEKISLRSASPKAVLLQTQQNEHWVTIGKIEAENASWMVHPQAIYLHEAKTFLVEQLDLEQGVANLCQVDVDYFTEPKSEISIQLNTLTAQSMCPGGVKAHGDITVTNQVTGFHQVKWFTHERISFGNLSLPPSTLITTGYWLSLSEQTVSSLRQQGLWTNDPNVYGPQWDSIRSQVRTRDSYRCQLCGAVEQNRSHDVHHITPIRSYISIELANQLSNLITLCSTCHQKVETTVRLRSGLAGLAYTLGHLAPLFLMCDTRDLGIHSDPISPLANGEPSIILYDQVPAGIGFSEHLFELHQEMISQAYDLVLKCECTDGCPSCVGPAGESGIGGKEETLAIVQILLPDK